MLGVATRIFDHSHSAFTVCDECLLTFRGFVTFRDEVKASAGPALRNLMDNGVAVKVGLACCCLL